MMALTNCVVARCSRQLSVLLAIGLLASELSAQHEVNVTPAPAATSARVPSTANPGEGILLIDPPTPGPLGNAATSVPLNLPPGRMGMEPAVSIDYHHEHQHGWLGTGWDLSLPQITVETRWGVPRYSATQETETYQFDGQQLAPIAHRGGVRARTPELRFYERVEGDFARIHRHGNGPTNYWWEIERGDGSVEYYGGDPARGVSNSATLASPQGNLAAWSLTARIDAHGNRIDYHYARQEDPGRTGSAEPGTNLYPDYVTYTGHGEEEGPFRIDFVRDRELGEARRPDVEIDGTLGFKRVTADLLRRIEISFNGAPVRTYVLNYRRGLYERSLLEGVVEIDANGKEFYRHTFDYYDELTVDGRLQPYAAAETWSTGEDGLQGPLLNPIPLFPNDISSLGSSTSTNEQAGTAITFGLAGSPVTKDLTVGGTVGFGASRSSGTLALVDINGDLRPDKVFKQGDGLRYRANNGDGTFGPVRRITGISEFSFTETTETEVGFEANLTPVFAGYENSTSKSTTTTYFADFNGDELIDIVHRGQVYFNHLNGEGDPVFTRDSQDTPSPIISGAAPDPTLITVDPAEQEELIDMAPLHDVVRSWEAPWNGNITINAPVRLIEQNAYGRADGVTVSIQHGGTVRYRAELPAGDFTERQPDNVTNFPVRAGDRIYFRVQSIFDGAFDRVAWDPEIFYTGVDTSQTDVNGQPLFRYRASEDFLLASCQSVRMPERGNVRITGTFSKPRTTDSIRLEMIKVVSNRSEIVRADVFAPDSVVAELPVELAALAVDTNVDLQFRIRTSSNVDWTALRWNPRIEFTDGENTYCPAVDYTLYPKVLQPAQGFRVPTAGTYLISVTGTSQGAGAGPQARALPVNITLKTRDSLLATVSTTSMGENFFERTFFAAAFVTLEVGQEVFVEAFVEAEETSTLLVTSLQDSTAWAEGSGGARNIVAGLHRKLNSDEMTFGNGYRGWGQFVYNGNRARAALPLQENLLRLQEIEIDSSDLEGLEDLDPEDPDAFDRFDDLGGDPTQEIFVVMIADPKAGNWRGYDNLTLVGPGYQSSSRFGEDDILLTPDLGGGESTAPGIISESKIHAVAGGLSAGPGSLGASYANNTTRNVLDVIDMNGDRYPDLVTSTKIQYTGPYGGLENTSLTHGFGSHDTKSEAVGVTAGGGFVNSSPSNSGASSGKGSRRRSRRTKATVKNNGAKARSANESAEGAASISGNFTEDRDYAAHTWQDMNGDGLPDKVWRNGDVALNYGYRFGARENWGFGEIRSGVSYDYGAGVGINISNNSIAGGVGVSRTDNWSEQFLQDINGDGLTDRLRYNDDNKRLTVNLNHGAGFGPDLTWATLDERPDAGDATSESVNGAFTVCINIFFVRFCINPSGSAGRGVSRVLSQFNDVDGDGIPDAVTAKVDGTMTVRRGRMGRSNLLREFRGPLGAITRLGYARAPATYEMPMAKWVLAEVAVNDGLPGDGPDWRKARYDYAGPVYDRDEREFYGFREVREVHLDTEDGDAVYRTNVMVYDQANFYTKGLLKKEYLEDAQGRRFGTKEYEYTLYEPESMQPAPPPKIQEDGSRIFPALTGQWDRYQEGDSTRQFSERQEFTYDRFGNLLTVRNLGNGQPDDLEETIYTYHESDDRYLTDAVATVAIYGGGELLRRTETEITPEGQPRLIRRFIDSEGETSELEMTYDAFGNQLTESLPLTAAGERNHYTFTIDSLVHTYQISQTDGYGYVATASYDPRFGVETSRTDIQGNTYTFRLDERGRTIEVLRPLDSVYSYRYTYHPEATVPYAKTERYDPASGQAVASYTFSDGRGRIVQHKQQALVGENDAPQLTVSGKAIYDAFDRAKVVYHPAVEPMSAGATYRSQPATPPPLVYRYDILDRYVESQEAHGANSRIAYDIAPLPSGELLLRSMITDGRGDRSAEYTGSSGQLEALWTENSAGESWVLHDYNPVGDLLSTTDATGCATEYVRDLLGRTVRKKPCNAGPTDYLLDPAGLLVAKITPNLRALNPEEPLRVDYTYELDRLVRIDYPKNFQNRVELTYGEPDAPYHRAGRIWLTKDASGGQELFFDANGNPTKTIRTLLINEASVRTYVSEASYDSWGRITEMIYPDGERVTYEYGADGYPVRLYGERDGVEYRYVDRVTYDGYGEMTGLTFGNGVEQTYRFDPLSRRFSGLRIGEHLVMDYELDEIGSPVVIEQSGPAATSRQTFDYDENHQLIEASGEWTIGDRQEAYSYFVDYDQVFNPKTQELRRYSGSDTLSRKLEYRYAPGFAHRVAEVSGRSYAYDANGNQLGYAGERGSYRYVDYRWDEEDRLMASSHNGLTMQYTYAADGSRAIESSARLSGVFTDGAPSGLIDHGSDYLAYVNPFFTARKDGFTKHYFLGDRRIASKEGTGEFNNYYWFGRGLTAGDQNYTARMQDLTATVWNYFGSLGVPPGPPTLPGYYAQPERTGEALPSAATGSFTSPPPGWPGPEGPPAVDGPPGPPTYFPPQTPRDSIRAGYGFTGYGAFSESDITYYHAGPLGNVHLTTNLTGSVREFLAYLPTGERVTASSANDYAFNGKQTDASGTLYDFGARFYDTETGLFLNQDPNAEDYPGFNPYAFGLNNPLAFNDPDGADALKVFNSPTAAAIDFARTYNKQSIAINREMGANIYRKTLLGRQVYFYEPKVAIGTEDGLSPPKPRRGYTLVGDIHTHGTMQENAEGYLEFSDSRGSGDIPAYVKESRKLRRTYRGYMVNPKGEVWKYTAKPSDRVNRRGPTYRSGREKLVSSGLPYDEAFYNGDNADAPRRKLSRFRQTFRMAVANWRARRTGAKTNRTVLLPSETSVSAVRWDRPRRPRKAKRAPGRKKRR